MAKPGFRNAAVTMFDAIEDAAAAFELVDGDLRITAANPAFAANFQTTPAELRGRDAATLYRPNEFADVLDHVRQALRDQAPVSYEAVRELPSGRRVIAATMVPAGDRQVVVLKRDVSREREALRRLDEIESLAQIGTWQWNLATDVVTWSDQYRRMLGVAPGTTPTMALVVDAVHPDDRPLVEELMADVATGTVGARTLNYRVIRSDGEVRHVETRGHVAVDEAGDLVRVFGTIQDVTERRLAERRRRDLEQVEERQRQAAELNDDIVQGLAATWLALQLGEIDEAMEVVQRTSQKAQQRVSDLIRSTVDARPVTGGVLARRNASNANLAEPMP